MKADGHKCICKVLSRLSYQRGGQVAVRAGVPILCDQAWTRDGLDRNPRPYHAVLPD